ncbi:MAG: putative sugar nucleotidyl transferase [Candidatus Krumholzibacteriia bacterium]
MRLLTVIQEDETLTGFRPLSWSRPVYELRCGILNLRERCELLRDDQAGDELGLLPHAPLAAFGGPDGVAVGAEPVAAACARADRVLLLNARLGPSHRLLSALLDLARQAEGWYLRDRWGVLASALGPGAARAAVAAWAVWDAARAREGCWRDASRDVAPLELGAADGAPRDGSGTAARAGGATGASGASGATGGSAQQAGSDAGGAPVCRLADAPAGGAADAVLAACGNAGEGSPAAFGHLWDLVPATAAAIAGDLRDFLAGGRIEGRWIFGAIAAAGSPPVWSLPGRLTEAGALTPGPAAVHGDAGVWLGADVDLGPQTVLAADHGPIVLDRGVVVEGLCYLAGPLYVGPGARIKAGARIYGETSVGAGCKLAGEVAESTFLDLGNKQHDGFIGHAYLGGWVNLGAGTTCSDLKNNYGTVRVDQGAGEVDTGQRFVGLLLGEHAKTAIGTMLNTGSCVGFASNVFARGFPPKFLPNFTWGDDPAGPPYDAARAAATARTVMARRGCRFTAAHEQLFGALARG